MLQEMARCCRRCWLGGWLRPGRTGEYDEPRSWCWVLLPRRSAWRPQLAPGYCPARPLTGYNKSTAPSPILPPPLLSCYYTTTLTTQLLRQTFQRNLRCTFPVTLFRVLGPAAMRKTNTILNREIDVS